MTNQLEKGLDRWQEIATALNTIIKKEGQIEINNPTIWGGFLHKWENEDWEQALTAVATLLEQHPDLFKKFHKEAFRDAASTLVKHMDTTDRVLDKRMFKKIAWRMIMTMREVWNEAQGNYVPNDKSARNLNEFNSLFAT